jgi:hypothetical protein
MPGELRNIFANAIAPTFSMWQCGECAAFVDPSQVWKHETWHQQMMDAIHNVDSRPVVIERPRDDLALRREIDGLYILLGEDPPFNDPESVRAV